MKKESKLEQKHVNNSIRPISYKINIFKSDNNGSRKNSPEAGFLNLKNVDLKSNGAYQLGQKIKVLQHFNR